VRDEDGRITSLTRDGEMSLSVLPLTTAGCLLDGQRIEAIAERDLAEQLNLNIVPCPASWAKRLHDCSKEADGPLAGLWQLFTAEAAPGMWQSSDGQFTYSQDFGLEKRRHEPA